MGTLYSALPTANTTFSSQSKAGGSVPATFDVFLYEPIPADRFKPLKLVIKLKIRLRPLPQRLVPLQLDFDGKPFWTTPWTPVDWQRFLHDATAQAEMWNNNFWLVPPRSFDGLDVLDSHAFDRGASRFRPNIRCALVVDWEATDNVHRTIDVANLDLRMLAGLPQSPGTFRSHALLYDSLDAVPWAFPYGTGPGQPARHFTIAHEIGHAIGLDHIGVLRKTPLCRMAMIQNELGLDKDPLARGGPDSFFCYGYKQGIGVVGNIMGAGEDFAVENARPWIWAIIQLKGQRPGEMWTAVTTDPGPGKWV